MSGIAEKERTTRALALLSGGLDSLLAIKVVLEQGVEVEALNFVSVFCTCTPKGSSCSAARSAAQQLGIDVKTVNTSKEFLDIVRNPKHGYGRNLNPCLDCRILMFRTAHARLEEAGASFVVTGEVLGERPMSQRREAMALIEREAGLAGLIVRPLSAALLEPSIPEQKGWVDRKRLLSIRGRSRKPQIKLARDYGLTDYPCPAGGCLLTDAGFAGRMWDLMKHEPGFALSDVQLLKHGKHFRLSPGAKAIVGRDEEDNRMLSALAGERDRLLEVVADTGPLTVVRGSPSREDLLAAAAITARYSHARTRGGVRVRIMEKAGVGGEVVEVSPATEEYLAAVRIGILSRAEKRA